MRNCYLANPAILDLGTFAEIMRRSDKKMQHFGVVDFLGLGFFGFGLFFGFFCLSTVSSEILKFAVMEDLRINSTK